MSERVLSHWIGAALLAVAVSLDGFAAGVAYGLRRIKLSVGSLWLTGVPSGLVVLAMGLAGHAVFHAVGLRTGQVAGGLVLIVLGIRSLIQTRRSLQRPAPDLTRVGAAGSAGGCVGDEAVQGVTERTTEGAEREPAEPLPVWTIRVASFGLILQVLREPTRADLDCSGGISPVEALILGVALALDAGGAGLGAGLTGFAPYPAAVAVVLADVAFLRMGVSAGCLLAARAKRVAALMGLLPGVILLAMGVSRLLG